MSTTYESITDRRNEIIAKAEAYDDMEATNHALLTIIMRCDDCLTIALLDETKEVRDLAQCCIIKKRRIDNGTDRA
tara:strand:- start:3564 stop:3791 length:228 start_codon:yes stop_codon:yes gene_type:complete